MLNYKLRIDVLPIFPIAKENNLKESLVWVWILYVVPWKTTSANKNPCQLLNKYSQSRSYVQCQDEQNSAFVQSFFFFCFLMFQFRHRLWLGFHAIYCINMTPTNSVKFYCKWLSSVPQSPHSIKVFNDQKKLCNKCLIFSGPINTNDRYISIDPLV